MPTKVVRILFLSALISSFVVIKLNEWMPSFWWFVLLMAFCLSIVGYCQYKTDDWLLEEAEEIKKWKEWKDKKNE